MKKLLAFAILLILPGMAYSAEVSFKLKNFESNNGTAIIDIFNNPQMFLEESIPSQCTVGKIANREASITCQIPSGNYAVSVYHDENGNGDLDTNWLTIPKESVGFSRNAKGTFGPPDFEDAAFQVGTEKLEFVINLEKF